MVSATSKVSDQPAHMQSDQSLCLSFEYSMSVKLLTEHHLELVTAQAGLSLYLSKCTSLEIMCHVSYTIGFFSYLYLNVNVCCGYSKETSQ